MLFYLTVMFRPLIPLVSDAWAHGFNEVTHVATVHAKYGKNHLEHEVANSASDRNNTQHAINPEDQIPLHLSPGECRYHFTPDEPTNLFFDPGIHKLTAVFISKQAPPPKCC